MMMVLAMACSEARTMPVLCEDDAGACGVQVHAPGILDPASPDFHPRVLARERWDLRVCARCHGDDFAGGTSGQSCLGCHVQGPTACATCHGPGALDEPKGNHAPHFAAGFDCSACHIQPATWDAPGHIVSDAPPAEVTFGTLANLTPPTGNRSASASWDGMACRNVYCHGDVTRWWGGTDTEPRWDEPPPRFTCDHCHGAPPPDHPRLDCASCHPGGSAHADGIVEVHPPR
jgi:predicted CxxxxCH...CXXCH cytochrome family protein